MTVTTGLNPRRFMQTTENPVTPKLLGTFESSATADAKGCFCVMYTGRSMNPTLMEPELIEVVTISADDIRKGDVILFRRPDDTNNVVHRVVYVSSGAFRTRGDNNCYADTFPVTADEIIGLAVASWRGSRRRIIHGGIRGRVISWLLLGRSYVLMIWGRLLADAYRFISRICSPVAQRILSGQLRPRIVRYPEHVLWRYQLFIGKKLIGRCHATTGQWEIRRPYRLIVDITKLPHPQ